MTQGTLIRRFGLGRLYVTTGAAAALDEAGETPLAYIARHARGEWGEVCAEDAAENELSIAHGFRILSAYTTRRGDRLYVITEADRSATTALLSDEY